MSSGTDAQIAALMALEIGPGDAVLTTPYTFFATAGCVARVGARSVFVDIDAATFNLSPVALAAYLHHTARRDADGFLRTPGGEQIKAIIPVHLFGLCCDILRRWVPSVRSRRMRAQRRSVPCGREPWAN